MIALVSLCAPAADGYRHDGYPPLTATAAATATHPTARVRLVSLKTDGDLMDVAALIAENDGPRQRLASQPVIEQAKGILMGHCRITDDTAFELLRRWSQDSNTKIRHIAELLTASAASGVGDRLTPHKIVEQNLALSPRCRAPGP